ncbi:MAG: hypothetical protein FWG25_02730 [Promicromonosporaceae bacterium]|nr:hypothetical protein [Promicromonosporaceae bacterium]
MALEQSVTVAQGPGAREMIDARKAPGDLVVPDVAEMHGLVDEARRHETRRAIVAAVCALTNDAARLARDGYRVWVVDSGANLTARAHAKGWDVVEVGAP